VDGARDQSLSAIATDSVQFGYSRFKDSNWVAVAKAQIVN